MILTSTACIITLMGPPPVAGPVCEAAAYHGEMIEDTQTPPQKPRHGTLPPSPEKMNMVTIPRGSYFMGSPREENRREAPEGPVHQVEIAYIFEVGKYEVTFDDWNTCVIGGGCRGYRPDDEGWGQGRRPVINISWKDAKSYIRWLNKVTGLKYRLLSEAEWEYVARAGSDLPFHTGRTITTDQANFNGEHSYNGSPKGVYRKKTLPVGSFPPNRFGLYDVHGNVFEWLEDCWSDNYVGAPAGGQARKDGDCNYRVMRGGSWVTHPYQIRAAKRFRYTTDYRYEDYGFRIARTLSY